jgi:hypothetical protein
MAIADVLFMYDGKEIELQFVGLKNREAELLYLVIKTAADNGQNDHIRGFGWRADTQGVMVIKGEK